MSSFYAAQFRLYEHIRSNISRNTQIRSSRLPEIHRLEAAARCAKESEALLRQAFEETSSLYCWSTWAQDNRWEKLEQSLLGLSPKLQESGNMIILQAASLQIVYDSALILVHQPLLESSMNAAAWSDSTAISVQRSLRVAVEAASRISRFPVHIFQKHYSISFVTFHLFTAGVILSLVPPAQPFGSSAQEAKAGVLRIIQTCRSMRDKDRAAKHTEEILVELLKVTTTRETNIALRSAEVSEQPRSFFTSPAQDQTDQPGQTASQTRLPNTEKRLDSYPEDPPAEQPLTARRLNLLGQYSLSAPNEEPPNLNTDSAPLGSEGLFQTQALQQSDETFGSYGKCKQSLLIYLRLERDAN